MSQSFDALQSHATRLRGAPLSDLLAREPERVRPLPAIARFALGETEVRSALPSAGLFPAPPTPTDPDAA